MVPYRPIHCQSTVDSESTGGGCRGYPVVGGVGSGLDVPAPALVQRPPCPVNAGVIGRNMRDEVLSGEPVNLVLVAGDVAPPTRAHGDDRMR